MYTLSAIKMSLGEMQESESLLVQALESDPKIGESYWRLMYFYNVLGNKEKVIEIMKEATEKDVKFSEQDQQMVDSIINSVTQPAN